MKERLKATPGQTRIGWIGTGVMGQSMAGHLLGAGFELTVFSRTKSKAQPLLEAGAEWAESPAAVAERCEVLFLMVGFPQDVRDLVLGESGVLSALREGSILVDMTTSEPTLAEQIAQRAEREGVVSLDAPVSGGDVGARGATLSIMVGGELEAYENLQLCWQAMGKTVEHQGPPGSGQHAKMVNQTLVAAGMVGICEALLYAHQAGLDIATTLRSVSYGAAGSWALSHLAPRIVRNDFEPGFYVEHFIKDMEIALVEAQRMGLTLPGLTLAKQLYLTLAEQGFGRKGTQALQLALAKMNGLDWVAREASLSNPENPSTS